MTDFMGFNIKSPKSSKAAHYLNLVLSNLAKVLSTLSNAVILSKNCRLWRNIGKQHNQTQI